MTRLAIAIGRGASRLPADLALSAIPSLPRPILERLAQSIIDRLDDMDGDNDLEPNGDEQDGNRCEDDEMHHYGDSSGCPIADPPEDCRRNLPPPSYDGEDQCVIILPAPKGIEPTRWKVS
jgi:hypothetical protein